MNPKLRQILRTHGFMLTLVNLIVPAAESAPPAHQSSGEGSHLQLVQREPVQRERVQREQGQEKLDDVLNRSTRWHSSGTSLDTELRRLSEQSGLTVLRDRRLDPHQLCEFSVDGGTLRSVVNEITQQLKEASYEQSGELLYIAPRQAARRYSLLPDLFDEQMKLVKGRWKADSLAKVQRNYTLNWQQLTSPREILEDLSQQSGTVFVNLDDVPHDLWGELRLPAMSFERCALTVLNQFDLTIQPELSDGQFRISAPDTNVTWRRVYRIDRKFREKIEEDAKAVNISADVRWTGDRAQVEANLEGHLWWTSTQRQFEEPTQNPNELVPPAGIKQRLFTLQVERATIGALIREFRKQGIPIEIADEMSEQVQTLLTNFVQVKASRQPALQFFSDIFGDFFEEVVVEDDRVLLKHPRQR
ncbi:MAG: hypothetical protein JNL58_20040 [Planctomyces sp.]|nr:hypothetical protein [Planctomyces sp.]